MVPNVALLRSALRGLLNLLETGVYVPGERRCSAVSSALATLTAAINAAHYALQTTEDIQETSIKTETTRVTVFNEEIPSYNINAIACITRFTEILNKIPIEYRASAQFVFRAVEDYDDWDVELEVYYDRPDQYLGRREGS